MNEDYIIEKNINDIEKYIEEYTNIKLEYSELSRYINYIKVSLENFIFDYNKINIGNLIKDIEKFVYNMSLIPYELYNNICSKNNIDSQIYRDNINKFLDENKIYVLEIYTNFKNIIYTLPNYIEFNKNDCQSKNNISLAYCGGLGIATAISLFFPIISTPLNIVSTVITDKDSQKSKLNFYDIQKITIESLKALELNKNLLFSNIINFQKIVVSSIFKNYIENNSSDNVKFFIDNINYYKSIIDKNIIFLKNLINKSNIFYNELYEFYNNEKLSSQFFNSLSESEKISFTKEVDKYNKIIEELIYKINIISNKNYEYDINNLCSFKNIRKKYEFDNSIDSLFKIANNNLYVSGSSRYFNENKLKNFKLKIDRKIEGNIIIFYDSSFFGSGNKGFCLTDKFLYSNIDNTISIDIHKIKNIVLKKEDIEIIFNDGTKNMHINILYVYKRHRTHFVDCLNNIIGKINE